MNQFFLNNAVGAPKSVADGSRALANVLYAFHTLVDEKSLNVSDRIVLEKDPDTITFGNVQLFELVEGIEDPAMRMYAYSCLKKAYPVEDYFQMDDEAWKIAEGEYQLNGNDAVNLAVVCSQGGYLFTLAFNQNLRSNQLTLTSILSDAECEKKELPTMLNAENLWGDEANTAYIRGLLDARANVTVSILDEIKKFGILFPTYERDFPKLKSEAQQSFLDAFREAERMNMLYPIDPSRETVIHSLVGWKKYPIYEIAIQHPVALRTYIAQHDGNLCIISIGKKYSNKQRQKDDILRAEKLFKNYWNLK